MEIDNLIPATTSEDLRRWLQDNGKTEKCCWVIVSMTPTPDKMLYLDTVEQCLCFGWIDGIKKTIPGIGTAQRLSPRSRKSSWTELNKERARRLEKLGHMTEEGRKVFPDMDERSFRIDGVIEQRLRSDKQTYEHFLAFPPLYRRVRIDQIQSLKNQPELFNSRLEKFIANTAANKMYGQWNDGGRLLDY